MLISLTYFTAQQSRAASLGPRTTVGRDENHPTWLYRCPPSPTSTVTLSKSNGQSVWVRARPWWSIGHAVRTITTHGQLSEFQEEREEMRS